jgi:hypothetical protein
MFRAVFTVPRPDTASIIELAFIMGAVRFSLIVLDMFTPSAMDTVFIIYKAPCDI